jgi:hypothetical protein
MALRRKIEKKGSTVQEFAKKVHDALEDQTATKGSLYSRVNQVLRMCHEQLGIPADHAPEDSDRAA